MVKREGGGRRAEGRGRRAEGGGKNHLSPIRGRGGLRKLTASEGRRGS